MLELPTEQRAGPVFSAAQHCLNVAKRLTDQSAAFFVQGFGEKCHPDSDGAYSFIQDSNMLYVSGVNQQDFALFYDISSQTPILLTAYVSPDDEVWIGKRPTFDDLKKKYGFERVAFFDAIPQLVKELGVKKVYRVGYQSDALLKGLDVEIDSEELLDAIHEARVYKDSGEIELLKKASDVSSIAHEKIMKEVKVGQAEYNACGKFVGKLLEEGCQCEAYTSIFAKGRNAATLHYIDNNQIMDDESELILVDAAGRYNGYNADITRTWPIGPKFTPKAREIYQIVLDMQMACLENIRPHVQWEDIHRISTRIGAQGLLDIGVLKGNLEDILASHVFGYFMPHGVGHFLGIDVHDCAGYPKGVERINEPGIRYLRVRRELLEGMVLTVEPGIYFVDDLINDLKKSPVLSSFVDFDRVQEYRCVGGVRIEDNIVVTSNGHLNLTTCPKTVEDIEKLRAMAY